MTLSIIYLIYYKFCNIRKLSKDPGSSAEVTLNIHGKSYEKLIKIYDTFVDMLYVS